MLLVVGDFCERVESDLNGLVDELVQVTNRHSTNEYVAWQNSLQQLSKVLSNPFLKPFHIQLGSALSLEYNLPASSSWCDAVLLGHNGIRPQVHIIEMKDWDLTGDEATDRETLVKRHGVTVSHPSDQVRGYVEYCQFFHSEAANGKADVSGSVFFTKNKDTSIYGSPPYSNLVSKYPVFTRLSKNTDSNFSEYLCNQLKKPDPDFAQRFEHGVYIQDRNLVRQMSKLIQDNDQGTFVLLDNQRMGYELCLLKIDELLQSNSQSKASEKLVVIIEGPPGSGKSVLAAKIWAALAHDSRNQGSVVMTTTSSSQRTNWQVIFEKVVDRKAGRGMILPANKYNPGINLNWVNAQRERGMQVTEATWRENLRIFEKSNLAKKMPDNAIWASVIDEAHALIDPSIENRRGSPPSGWTIFAGPQAYNIIRGSRISIFLMDKDQSYRDNETTTMDNIIIWAKELGVSDSNIIRVSLDDTQFRSGGSKEYISWVEKSLDLSEAIKNLSWWKTIKNPSGVFEFGVVPDPEELVHSLRGHIQTGNSARIVASYSRKWVSKGIFDPHLLPPEKMDFHIRYTKDGKEKWWSRIWNYTPKQSYDLFIQAPEGSKMNEDPLCEVGCPYVVRGFDYDYLGILWLSDLVWRKDRWMGKWDQVFETAWPLTKSRARKEGEKGVIGLSTNELTRQLKRGYRILMTRALKGIYVWFEDNETKDHVLSLLE